MTANGGTVPISSTQCIAAHLKAAANRRQLPEGGMTGRAWLSGLASVKRRGDGASRRQIEYKLTRPSLPPRISAPRTHTSATAWASPIPTVANGPIAFKDRSTPYTVKISIPSKNAAYVARARRLAETGRRIYGTLAEPTVLIRRRGLSSSIRSGSSSGSSASPRCANRGLKKALIACS
jgi:hypothetical protein